MFKLAQAYQTGRSGQRSFVMAYRWYATLIAEDGPAAFWRWPEAVCAP